MIVFSAVLIGFIAGLRTMVAPAAIAWGAWLGWIDLSASWAGFMASPWAVGVFSILALVELAVDKLPSTPSRKTPSQFAARVALGGLCGAALGAAGGAALPGLAAGLAGAVLGTYCGAWARGRLATAFGRDRPAAALEDAVAILGGLVVVGQL